MKGVEVFGRLVCLAFFVYASAATAGNTNGPWTWERPLVTGVRLTSIAESPGGELVVVGVDGAMFSSADGSSWTPVRTLYGDYTTNDTVAFDGTDLNVVTYWHGLFIAGGVSGILTSTDGSHWSAASIDLGGSNFNFTAFAATGSRIIATGGAGQTTLYESSDGKSWKRLTGFAFPPAGVAQVLNGEFYVTLQNSSTLALELEVSADGQTWTQDTTFPSGGGSVLVSSGSLLMSLANGALYTTTDGNTWSAALTIPAGTASLQWTGREFVLMDEVAPTYYTSADGTSWTSHPLPADGAPSTTSSHVAQLLWTGSQYVGTGFAGAIYTSPDGSTWTAVSTPGNESFDSAVWDGSKFLVYGQRGEQFSGDGTSWTMTPLTGATASVAQVAKGDQLYLGFAAPAAVGGGGFVAVSTDGIAWQAPSGLTQSYTSAAQCGNTAVALSSNESGTGVWSAVADVSSGFLTWTERRTPFTNRFGVGLACGNGVFVADLQEIIATSTDGLNWTSVALPANTVSDTVTFQNGRFIVTAQQGELFTSTDGAHWTTVMPTSSQAPPAIPFIFWDGKEYIAYGPGLSNPWSSPDLQTWYEDVDLPGLLQLGMAAGGGHVLAVSFDGQIAESTAGAGSPASLTDLSIGAPDLPSTSASGQCKGSDPAGRPLVYELTNPDLSPLGGEFTFDSLTGAFTIENFEFTNKQNITFLCRVSDGLMISSSLVTLIPKEAPPPGGGGGTPPPTGGGSGGGGGGPLGGLSLLMLLGVVVLKRMGSASSA